METDKFIFTEDKAIADKLLLMGLVQIPSGSFGYKFINRINVHHLFSDEAIDESKIRYTNIYTL